ncbi:MAG: SsrA-binding protein SmpB [candidate division KSB1 bacterium]|nr:SsrA-binding protein SmpB [candidate division KSB1 bacterium]MDZ7302088.1 SsrA-binding protein SmpB [candidate division KSB1 bacterium]MDZ7311129.1 SsrA-binding protein SmpB [candidate division KSB1 bacterium]
MPKSVQKKTIAQNRKARHNYEILETYETGIVLVGTEVKSLREGRANFKDAYADIRAQEVWLHGMHISPYSHGNINNHDPERDRKLLLHRNEIRRLLGKTKETGLTLVPLQLYFKNGKIKVELALAKGKKLYDKREAIAKKDAERETKRHLKTWRTPV